MTAEKPRQVTPKTPRTAGWAVERQAGRGIRWGQTFCRVFTGHGCKKGSNKMTCIY